MLAPNGVIIPVANSDLISTVESLTPTHELENIFNDVHLNSPSTSPNTIFRPSPLIRSRSSSSSQPSHNNSATSINPATLSPQPSRHFAIRPSPIVSVPASPSFSRPNSPGPNNFRSTSSGLGQPGSPANKSSNDLTLSGSGILPPQMAGSHIFERDVEFPSSHHISPSEAVDVAIPAVLDEAALALSNSDPLSSADFNNYVRESEEGGSGWTSPVPNYSPPTPTSSSRSPNRNHHHQTTASSSNPRSFSPDRLSGGRGTSPGGANSASFSFSTPSNSPPSSFHPFIQHLSEALESEANSHRGGNVNFNTNSSSCVTEAPSTSTPLLFPTEDSNTSSSPFTTTETSPSVGSLLFSNLTSSKLPSSNNSLNDLTTTTTTSNLEAIPVRNPRLSFTSYADILNEERLNEMLGNPREG